MVISSPETSRPWNLLSSWLCHKDARLWEEKFRCQLTWEQPKLLIYGRRNLIPRKTTFLAEKGISYKYSGHNHYTQLFPAWFRPLIDQVNEACDVRFNGCLLNYYRNGLDHMGWHSDNEDALDKSKPIASLSIGTSRDFFLKHRSRSFKEKIELKDGDLLVMYPPCQENWVHSIPVRRRVFSHRINLTFRCFLVK